LGTANPASTVSGDVWYRSNNLFYNDQGTVRTIANTTSWALISEAAINTGTETTSRFISAARLRYNTQRNSIILSGTENFVVTSTGWKRVAVRSGSSGRGYGDITLYTTGGSTSPSHLNIRVFKNWDASSNGYIVGFEQVGFPATGVRIVRDTVNTNDYYVEVNFATTVDSGNGKIYSRTIPDSNAAFGYHFYERLTGTLSDGGGTELDSRSFTSGLSNSGVYSRRLFAERIASGNVTSPNYLIEASDTDSAILNIRKTGGTPVGISLVSENSYNAIYSTAGTIASATNREFRIYIGNTQRLTINTSGTLIADGYAMSSSMIINETTTSRTLSASDNGKVIRCSNSGNVAISVPSGLGDGYSVTIIQENTGQVTISEVAASGVTINNRQSHTKTAGRWATVSLVAITANNFVLAGDTAA